MNIINIKNIETKKKKKKCRIQLHSMNYLFSSFSVLINNPKKFSELKNGPIYTGGCQMKGADTPILKISTNPCAAP